MSKNKIIAIVIVLIVIIGGVFAYQYCNTQKQKDYNIPTTADWKQYQWNNLEFMYPQDWTVAKDYYLTFKEGGKADQENVGLSIFPGTASVGADLISIGGNQQDCQPDKHHTKCEYISSVKNYIYTNSSNPEILKVFNQMAPTVTELK